MPKKHSADKSVVIKVSNIHKTYDTGFTKVHALRGANLEVNSMDFVIIFGSSGCGKSTLLNIILGLDKPEKGSVLVRGENIYKMDDDRRAYFRSNRLGVVYQQPTWIKSLSVLDNVAFPLYLKGLNTKSARKIARKRLIDMGMEEYVKHRPVELSGGQQQKVGFARAIVNNPWTILLDEPTGNLDSTSGDELIGMLRDINKEKKRTIIMVTHNYAYLIRATKVIYMKDGKVAGEYNGSCEIQKFIRNHVIKMVEPTK